MVNLKHTELTHPPGMKPFEFATLCARPSGKSRLLQYAAGRFQHDAIVGEPPRFRDVQFLGLPLSWSWLGGNDVAAAGEA